MVQNLLVVGGDLRMEQMGRLLAQEGFRVERIKNGRDRGWREKAANADALLLPYPYAQKEGKIPGWEHGGERLEELLKCLKPYALVIAGAGVENTMAAWGEQGCSFSLKRYTDDPLFAQRNAEISAEAAVCEAMQRSHRMLDEQNILVLGYGLFARAIVWRLKALGARVWVAARRDKSRKQAMQDGAQAISFEQIVQIAPQMQIVMNTVPAVVVGPVELSRFPDEALLMELASPPYGINLSAAVELEKNVVVLPGLPSRYAPLSAAKALKEAVMRQIVEADV